VHTRCQTNNDVDSRPYEIGMKRSMVRRRPRTGAPPHHAAATPLPLSSRMSDPPRRATQFCGWPIPSRYWRASASL